jgi:hypothetical protein
MLPTREAIAGRAGAEIEDLGTTAWERGRAEIFDGQRRLLGRGKYLVIWKHSGEGWRIHRDIMNTDAPPAAP